MSTPLEKDVKSRRSSDPNLALFSDDQYRYKAFVWYCIKTICVKVSVILAGSITAISGLLKIIGTLL